MVKYYGVELNRGATAFSTASGFSGGTNLFIDASSVRMSWQNSILVINKPVSPSNQATKYDNAVAFTRISAFIIQKDTTTFNSSVVKGFKALVTGSDIEYTVISRPATNQLELSPAPPATGSITTYKAASSYLMDMKRIAETVTIDGYLTNDYIHHKDFSSKYYAEEKLATLLKIIGDTAGTDGLFNMSVRRDLVYPGRYYAISSTDAGKLLCKSLTVDDTPKNEGEIYSNRLDKLKITLTVQMGGKK